MEEYAFLSERRRSIVEGETAEDMGIADATYRQHRAAVKRQARLALQELLKVASSPVIDNSDIFEPELVRTLVQTLIRGSGGLGDPHESVPATAWATEPDEDYAREVYISLIRAVNGTNVDLNGHSDDY